MRAGDHTDARGASIATVHCPICKSEMRAGRVGYESPEALRLAVGGLPGSARLRFSIGDDEIVPDLRHTGFHCEKCDTVMIPGALAEALDCFECGATIPGDAAACPACGWRW